MTVGLVFAVNGVVQRIESGSVDPSMRVSTYLRDVLLYRGTKIGCGEGGCGACSILLSRWDATMGKVVTVSANACLRPLVTVHGFNITTVEGIGGPNNSKGFHAVQKKFAELSASQCGFCTPGFVVAVYGQLASKENNSLKDMESCLDGNLCRCTGYRPIMDAAKSFAVSDVESSQNSEGGAVQAELDAMFPSELKSVPKEGTMFGSESQGLVVLRADTLSEAKLLISNNRGAQFACSQTSAAIYKSHLPLAKTLIDITQISELRDIVASPTELRVGAATPLQTFMGALLQHSTGRSQSTVQAFGAIADIVNRIANQHVRNVGSIGGNLSMCKELGFASDLATPLCGVGAKVRVIQLQGDRFNDVTIPLLQYVSAPSEDGVRNLVVEVIVPFVADKTVLQCYRTAIRSVNAHAITNAAFRATIDSDGLMTNVEAVFGAVGEFDVPGKNAPRRHDDAVHLLEGKVLSKSLMRELEGTFTVGDFVVGDYKKNHRRRLVKAYLLQYLDDLRASAAGRNDELRTNKWNMHTASQTYTPAPGSETLGKAIPRPDGVMHASGAATFISDMKEPKDTLFASYVISTCPKGKIVSIDVEGGLKMPGVRRVVTAADLKATSWCNNEIYSIFQMLGRPAAMFPNMELLASENVSSCGQVVALVLADSLPQAQLAAKLLSKTVVYDAVKDPVVTISQAIDAGRPRIGTTEVKAGDVEVSRKDTSLMHSSTRIEQASQKHFYMETHTAFAIPHDHKMEVYVPNQAPEYMALAIAKILDVPNAEVSVNMYRTGGSFGGKVAADHGCLAAVAAKLTGRPVKIQLDRNTDMQFQGGREDAEAVALVDFDKEGRIHGVELNSVMNCGRAFDSSAFPVCMSFPNMVLKSYNIPNKKVVSSGVLTDTVSRTATRAPGEAEAAYIGETLIDFVASELGVHSSVVRDRNFRAPKEGEVFTILQMYEALMEKDGWRDRIARSIEFNESSRAIKKGVSVTPFCYGVSTARAQVQMNIYRDGSVLVHHSGSEIGQAINLKILQAACTGLSKILGEELPLNIFRSAGNQTEVLPQQGITGGSTASESNVLAVFDATEKLAERLKPVAEELKGEARNWKNLISTAALKDVNLSVAGEVGRNSVVYECFCVGAAEVTTDIMTGKVVVERVDIKYDAARSLNPAVDIGQVEGAFMMGLGHMLLEDPFQNPTTGWLDHDGTWDYKIPGANDVPKEFNVELIENEQFTKGVNSSKATGEPPLCVSPCISSAVYQCIMSARKDSGLGGFPQISNPLTPDRVAGACGSYNR